MDSCPAGSAGEKGWFVCFARVRRPPVFSRAHLIGFLSAPGAYSDIGLDRRHFGEGEGKLSAPLRELDDPTPTYKNVKLSEKKNIFCLLIFLRFFRILSKKNPSPYPPSPLPPPLSALLCSPTLRRWCRRSVGSTWFLSLCHFFR